MGDRLDGGDGNDWLSGDGNADMRIDAMVTMTLTASDFIV